MLHNTTWKWIGLLIATVLAILLFGASVVFGYADTSWHTVKEAFTAFNGSNEHIIIRDLRIPRACIALLVGAALAASGALMQAITRNPMASPGILGVNAGGGFFVVAGISLFSAGSVMSMVWLAFAGAAFAAVSIYVVAQVGKGGITPLKLTLAGATLAALFTSFTTALLIGDERTLDVVLFWLAGSVQGKSLEQLTTVLPFLLVGYVMVLLMGRSLNLYAMGEQLAKGLGQRVQGLKVMSLLAVIVLAGSSVAVAGPIGFVGLVIPHIVRALVGPDHRWVIPYCLVLGGSLLLAADLGARFIAFPKEVPVGVMTALVGAPFFIYLARRGMGPK
ncbi:FecCD family ABC transporter permease [Cohnella abietis]|uniref:Putative siderophore transport system permease protein YfiZ n=1 Tax=Cohnella abietis TaxID=2507935 RepID=A0A3T1D695_9BACL|nr:iron ABC transporter permease [Cohnella abietis]BBI33591.1 putative siderophore transport system permease protein YfiZ [Cohnella abietis]